MLDDWKRVLRFFVSVFSYFAGTKPREFGISGKIGVCTFSLFFFFADYGTVVLCFVRIARRTVPFIENVNTCHHGQLACRGTRARALALAVRSRIHSSRACTNCVRAPICMPVCVRHEVSQCTLVARRAECQVTLRLPNCVRLLLRRYCIAESRNWSDAWCNGDSRSSTERLFLSRRRRSFPVSKTVLLSTQNRLLVSHVS